MNEESPAWQVRVARDADITDPQQTGPPDLDVWTRFVGAPDDAGVRRRFWRTPPTASSSARRCGRTEGVGQAQAHVTLSTGVLSHTLTFHEPFYAGDWLLLSHHSAYTGRGRAYGRANVFREDGSLVASFVQDGLIRPMSTGSKL